VEPLKQKTLRCAIYTRKSSEEGLEQEFNSLHAQREACEAFIRSQQGEGWQLRKNRYDDGGLSGATMERPALRRLLADIEERLVDVVVVYKVDRLTRSLSDFARMVEIFDRHEVSFVAVTQQFNTTTSMGRLTLNVLLSFAQFEREVTGERIRDKIAASKRKGMWMGGLVPLGYEVHQRQFGFQGPRSQRFSSPRRLLEAPVLYLPRDWKCVPNRAQSRLRVRIDCAPPFSPLISQYFGEFPEIRACARDLRSLSDPENTSSGDNRRNPASSIPTRFFQVHP
jgi:DNA invertase Pin-like site-specific DNA recombinase